MHEFSLATQIVEGVRELAQSRVGNNPVVKVRLLVGELAGIEAEQLRFCYNSITRETPLEHSTLEITVVAAQVGCGHCLYRGLPKYVNGFARARVPTLQCPQCGKSVEALQGQECELKSIQFAEASSPTLFHSPAGDHHGTSLNAS
jgi:hydrogenase nickel incorporation protein HypA/HybF